MPSSLLDPVSERLRFLSDYFYLTYTGSLPQWHAFLERKELRPSAFEHITLAYENGKSLRFDSPRLRLDTTGIVSVGPQSTLDLQMNYILDRGTLSWDVGGVIVHEDRDKKTWIALYRQAQPAEDAGKERRERWQHMSQRDGDFAGIPGHDEQFNNYWVRTVASGAAVPAKGSATTAPLYEVVYNTDNKVLPRQIEDIRANLARDLKVTE
jgi:serine protease Do